ncbi:hypothetical protein CK203_089414 [Vitis vinifera]|uniref:Uncharacterized protein n=1 Tax=Vitis vinifera TaxID=29760 RepID=A0A438E8S1_VITVI|nr:hypothetical protein CK203_089414 [Vitis vinifera]
MAKDTFKVNGYRLKAIHEPFKPEKEEINLLDASKSLSKEGFAGPAKASMAHECHFAAQEPPFRNCETHCEVVKPDFATKILFRRVFRNCEGEFGTRVPLRSTAAKCIAKWLRKWHFAAKMAFCCENGILLRKWHFAAKMAFCLRKWHFAAKLAFCCETQTDP